MELKPNFSSKKGKWNESSERGILYFFFVLQIISVSGELLSMNCSPRNVIALWKCGLNTVKIFFHSRFQGEKLPYCNLLPHCTLLLPVLPSVIEWGSSENLERLNCNFLFGKILHLPAKYLHFIQKRKNFKWIFPLHPYLLERKSAPEYEKFDIFSGK